MFRFFIRSGDVIFCGSSTLIVLGWGVGVLLILCQAFFLGLLTIGCSMGLGLFWLHQLNTDKTIWNCVECGRSYAVIPGYSGPQNLAGKKCRYCGMINPKRRKKRVQT